MYGNVSAINFNSSNEVVSGEVAKNFAASMNDCLTTASKGRCGCSVPNSLGGINSGDDADSWLGNVLLDRSVAVDVAGAAGVG